MKMDTDTMKRKAMKKEKTARRFMIALALILSITIGAAFAVPFTAEVSLAEQTPEDNPIVMQNEDGGEVIVDVEEELPADSDALREQEEAAGVVTLEEDEVPLAGFTEVQPNQSDGNIHLVWMILLLAAALGYIGYFTSYQNKLFDLRRKIADAEYGARKDGNRK